MSKDVQLSIIIVNYRGWKRLRLCLDSVRSVVNSFNWEIIVVDNHSSDNVLSTFIHDYPEIRFIENEGNFGFSNGCNLGARISNGKFLLLLNPDTVVTSDALQELLAVAVERPDFTAISCSQITDSGKDDRPWGYFPGPLTLTGFLRAIHKLVRKEPEVITLPSQARVIFPDWISGSVFLISRQSYNRLNGLSEDFWMYFEDTDLCKRIKNNGGRVAFLQNTTLIHNHGGASRVNDDVKILTKSEVIASKHVYIHKHFNGMRRWLMQSYLVVNNLFLGQLLLAIAGIFLFWIPSLRTYRRLYGGIVRYYNHALARRSWISERAARNYKPTVKFFRTAEAEAT